MALLLFVSIVLPITSDQSQASDVWSEERIRIEHESNIAYNNILNSYLTPEYEYDYNDIYSGAYLNPEGRLVVMITTTPDPMVAQELYGGFESNILSDAVLFDSETFNKKSVAFKDAAYELFALTKLEDGTELYFQEAMYSYSYLNSIMEELGNACRQHNNDKDSMWSQVTDFSLHDPDNCISVSILNIDDSKIERFLSEAGYAELFTFKNAEAFYEFAADVYAGHAVLNK